MGKRSIMSKRDLESLIEEALGNIRSDRKVAREFLNEIANQIATDAEQNKHFTPCEPLIAMAEAKEAFYAEQASAS